MIDAEELAVAAPEATIGDILAVREPLLEAADGLHDALGALADHRRSWAPVVSGGRLAGVLSARDAMAAYRDALRGNVRQVRALRADGVIVESDIGPRSALAGQRVADVPWPARSVLVAVARDDGVAIPRGDLVLAVGDRLSIFADAETRPALATLLASAAPPRVNPEAAPGA
jgi:trk system potassium uptake protein TrkA